MFHYRAYGLNITSEFHLPELPTGGNGDDLCIRSGNVTLPPLQATSIKRQGIEAYFGGATMEAYLRWPDVGRFLAREGRELIVAAGPAGAGNKQLLNLYILSEALGMILCQRGVFLLHASAVKLGEQVILFAGLPGAGKSTLAAAFAQQGGVGLCDDMVAITFEARRQPVVWPGFPQIKIWPPTIEGLGYTASSLPPLFEGSRKRVISKADNFPQAPLPLTHIFFLETAEAYNLRRMNDAEALFALVRFFPCPSDMLQGRFLRQHFQQCNQLLRSVEVWKLESPKNFKVLSKMIGMIEEQIRPREVTASMNKHNFSNG
ncbi:MAG: hypothetical protein ACRENG_33330 [bacterium]